MAHLSSKGILHGDLATRNVLVRHCDLLKQHVEVTDFGLAEILTSIHNTSGVGQVDVTKFKRKIPILWTAIEILETGNRALNSEKTDVWSFGVTVWEIFTLGKTPYSDETYKERKITKENLVHFLRSGGRLKRPSNCSDELYSVLLDCKHFN